MTLSARGKTFQRRNRRLPKSARAEEDPVAAIERRLDQALHVMAFPATLDSYDWGLLASIVVGAEAELREVGTAGGGLRPKFDRVMEELRDITADFTKVEFLRASRAARRDNPGLFAPGRGRGASQHPFVIPAQAGISLPLKKTEVLAFARMTGGGGCVFSAPPDFFVTPAPCCAYPRRLGEELGQRRRGRDE